MNWADAAADLTINKSYFAKNTKTLVYLRGVNDIELCESLNLVYKLFTV